MHVDSEELASDCIRIALCVAVLATVYFWGEWWLVILSWIAVYPMAIVISFSLGFILHYTGAKITTPSMYLDEKGENIVERSETIIGRKGEYAIHEWVTFKHPDNGELLRLEYVRCIDDVEDWDPPENRWFAIEPGGVLYVQPESVKD